MYCKNCGTQVPDDSRFCHNCGCKLKEDSEPVNEQKQDFQPNENAENTTTNQSNTQNHSTEQSQNFANNKQSSNADWSSFQTPDKQPQNNNNLLELVLRVFCIIFAVIFAYDGLSAIFSSIFNLDIYAYALRFSPIFIFTLPLSIVSGIVYIIAAIVLVVFAFKRSKENSAALFLALTISAVLLILMLILRQLFNAAAFGRVSSNTFIQFILPIICVGVVFGILHSINQAPDFSSFANNTSDKLYNAVKSVKDAFCELISSLSNRPQNPNNTANGQTYTNQNYNQQTYQNNFQQPPYQQPPYNIATNPLKQDRNIFVFIVLNIITCGIYGLYTIYSLASDVNTACNGDGKNTTGLLLFIILSVITCGIYFFYWHYSIANRISANAPRYGIYFQEDGTSVLLWMLLGSLICGIGYWIAYHIIFKNMNALAAAYNNRKF